MLDKETGRKLVDFIKGGYKLVTVGLMFNNQEKKNVIYKKQERIRANQIQFGRDENGRDFFLKKVDARNPSYPETEVFDDYEELREYLRSNIK